MAAHAGKTQQLPHQKTVGCVLLEFRRGYQDDKQYQERSLYFMNYLFQKKNTKSPGANFPKQKIPWEKIHRSKRIPWIFAEKISPVGAVAPVSPSLAVPSHPGTILLAPSRCQPGHVCLMRFVGSELGHLNSPLFSLGG